MIEVKVIFSEKKILEAVCKRYDNATEHIRLERGNTKTTLFCAHSRHHDIAIFRWLQ